MVTDGPPACNECHYMYMYSPHRKNVYSSRSSSSLSRLISWASKLIIMEKRLHLHRVKPLASCSLARGPTAAA